MSTALVTTDGGGLIAHRQATDAAGICRDVVLKTAITLQGRKYVRVEGWQAIANTYGCVASACDVEKIDGGYRATGQVRRIDNGHVIVEAEGFVGDDEKSWANRPEYAKRAMAQTRAISRACRSAFAFVVAMMDAGLETVPAEEVEHVEHHREPVVVRPKFEATAVAAANAGDMERSRLAVQKATTADSLLDMSQVTEKRLKSGFYTPAQADELLNLINGKLDWLSSKPKDRGTDSPHEAAEHEVTT
jgi:hypothetical protein